LGIMVPMNRKILIFSMLLALAGPLAAVDFATGTHPLVDGVYNSSSAIITGRDPILSWEYTGTVSSFNVQVALPPESAPTLLWDYSGSTDAATNTLNYVTRVPYNKDSSGTALQVGQTYIWWVTLYDQGTTVQSGVSQFTTVASVAALPDAGLNLDIDWNNPFNPAKGQVTKFVYGCKDRDRKVQLRVFSLSGMLVRGWGEQTMLKNVWLSMEWDGKNDDGEIVGRGIYLVNLKDAGDGKGVTKKIAVIKDK
jgi:hypothetical protein